MACVALPTCGLALAESERYLPDLLDGARRAARRARALRRRHRHPHDRLPERLRAALSRRDRLGRQRARPLQPLSRRRLRRLAPDEALRRGSRARRHRRRARSAVRRLCRASASRASASATSSSAPASSPRPATAATSTPIWEGRATAGGQCRQPDALLKYSRIAVCEARVRRTRSIRNNSLKLNQNNLSLARSLLNCSIQTEASGSWLRTDLGVRKARRRDMDYVKPDDVATMP